MAREGIGGWIVTKRTPRALALACALTLTLAGCGKVVGAGSDAGSASGSSAVAGSAAVTQGSAASATASDIIPTYQDIDEDAFIEKCDRLTELAQGNDTDAVIALYDEIYDELARIEDNQTAAYLAYCDDVSDATLSDHNTTAEQVADDCSTAALDSFAAVCKGPCADAFEEHVGQDAFEYYAATESPTKLEQRLSDRESELVNDYYTAIDKAERQGLSDKETNDKVGPIFIKLVHVRNKLAELYGYDSYADYADALYLRDYSAADLEQFYAAVKQISPRFYDLYYNSGDADAFQKAAPKMSADEVIDQLATYADQIDPYVSDAVSYLRKNHLYDIGSGSSRMDGAFTTYFIAPHTPFIYVDSDQRTDFQTMSHELGHFVDYHRNVSLNYLAFGTDGNLDISEIQSNGLQALYTHFYDDIYGAKVAVYAENTNVLDLVSNVVDGCVFDEFQRKVYAHPDMTLDEVDKLYQDICAEYGDLATGSDDYWWQYVSHTFDSPLYYMSYGVSGLAALQIWDQSQTDFAGACNTWHAIIDAGCYDYGYCELLKKVGLFDFTQPDKVVNVCNDALDYVEHNTVEGE